MAAPRSYNIILAGKYNVGKTSLFKSLTANRTGVRTRSGDKLEHVMSIGEQNVQVVLWDTADMERNSVNSMTKSYFAECVGVIMLYKKGDLQSLMNLDQWWNRAIEQSQFCSCLVFSLWCNDIAGDNSDDEVTDEHIQKYVKKWKVPSDLMFNISPNNDENSLQQNYEKLVEAVMIKNRHTHSGQRSNSTIILPDATAQSGNIQEDEKKKCSVSC